MVTDYSTDGKGAIRMMRELLEEYHSTLVSSTMNIPGPVKNSEPNLKGYLESLKLLRMQLIYADIPILHQEAQRDLTGNEAFLVVDAPTLTVKRLICEIEAADCLGRLFDLDALGPQGAKLDRKDVGLRPQVCLICGGPASVCASRRAHTVEELQVRTTRILQEHVHRQFADTLPGLAVCSLLEANSAFQAINHIGKRAELTMKAVTRGVNTYKGAIFSLGLLCGAAGRLYGRGIYSKQLVLRRMR